MMKTPKELIAQLMRRRSKAQQILPPPEPKLPLPKINTIRFWDYARNDRDPLDIHLYAVFQLTSFDHEKWTAVVAVIFTREDDVVQNRIDVPRIEEYAWQGKRTLEVALAAANKRLETQRKFFNLHPARLLELPGFDCVTKYLTDNIKAIGFNQPHVLTFKTDRPGNTPAL